MLFNSFEFILFFLPITLVVFFLIGKRNDQAAMSWLVFCSLFFYGWWNPAYLVLILFSMLFNYSFGVLLGNNGKQKIRKRLLILGIAVNIGLLGYFKYANFLVEQINWVTDSDFYLQKIILPLAISFFTFQQIAYLIDAFRHETKEYNFLHYCLFVTFFPQLIAGPIVHHKEMLPQFAKKEIYKINYEYISLGLTFFVIGLFKKVILADGVSVYVAPIFNAAEQGVALTFFEVWDGALAYTLQLYFDFSGYSDMAIGIAYMFGIKLPINFDSPYKATSIIDFWRRWHITLSRFLRDYLYFSLGGNRNGNIRRYVNLFLTMLLGGIWHGAGWTFVIWGMLHGFYLIINHIWRKLRTTFFNRPEHDSFLGITAARTLTLIAIIIGWVYFRADSISSANHLILIMLGNSGISLPRFLADYSHILNLGGYIEFFSFDGIFRNYYTKYTQGSKWIIILAFISFFAPNSAEIAQNIKTNLVNNKLATYSIALLTSLAFFISISHLMQVSDFLYFNF